MDWGLRGGILKALIMSTVAPIALYGVEVWGQRLKSCQQFRRKLDSVSRCAMLFLTKAYRTVSTDVLHALTGIEAFSSIGIRRLETYERKKWCGTEQQTSPEERPAPWEGGRPICRIVENGSEEPDLDSEQKWRVLTDSLGHEGIKGYVRVSPGTAVPRLDFHPDICHFQATCLAINWCLDKHTSLAQESGHILISHEDRSVQQALEGPHVRSPLILAIKNKVWRQPHIRIVQENRTRDEGHPPSHRWMRGRRLFQKDEEVDQNTTMETSE